MVLSDDFYYQPIRLDTINTQIYTDLIAKEGDAGGRGLKVTITENGVTKNTTGITLNLKWEHTAVADLQGLEPFEAVDLTKGIYKLKYPTNMLQKGTVKALIQIIDNGGLAGSRNLKIKVDSTVGDDTAMESSNEFRALASALVEVQGWNDRIDVVEQEFIDKANNLDATYPTRLVSVEQQLEQNKLELADSKRPSHAFNSLKTPISMISVVDDDGTRAVIDKLKPLAISKGIPFTLGIISEKMDSLTGDASFMGLNDVKDLYDNYGFEVQSHSKTHVAIASQSDSVQLAEIKDSYEKLNSLGFNVDYLIYPFGSTSKSVRTKVAKYYKGAIGTDAAKNTLPLKTFNLARIPLGYAAPAGSDTLAYYKSQVDYAIANNQWLIFMTHVANPAHTAEQQQHLSDLIDYIQTTTAKIVTLKEGYETIGNLMDIGDYTDTNYQYISADGKNNTNNTLVRPFDPLTGAEPITADTLPNQIMQNKVHINQIYRGAETAKMPVALAGTLTTVMTDSYGTSYQTYHTQQVSYKRTAGTSGTVWTAWYRLLEATQGVFNTTSSVLPAKTSVSKTIATTFYDWQYMPIFTPKFSPGAGVIFSVRHNGSYGQWVITLFNTSDVEVTVPAGDWAYMLIRL